MQDSHKIQFSEFQIIGKNMRKLRKKSGMTQRDVSELLGVSFQQIQKYERGENRLPVEKLFILKNYLGVSFDIFFHGLENRARSSALRSFVQTPLEKNEALMKLHFSGNPKMKEKIEQIILILLEE